MLNLLESIVQLVMALWQVLASVVSLITPWVALLAWVGFWLFAVNWVKLRKLLLEGGWVGLLLMGFMAIVVWTAIAPPSGGYHYVLGLTLTNFVGKTVYVTILMCILLLCGSVQLSGILPACCAIEDEDEDPGTAGAH